MYKRKNERSKKKKQQKCNKQNEEKKKYKHEAKFISFLRWHSRNYLHFFMKRNKKHIKKQTENHH